MMNMIIESLDIATASVAVRHGKGDATTLLDSLDKATDRVNAVRINCIEKLAARPS